MGYFEDKKAELQNLLNLLRNEQREFESLSNSRKTIIEEQIAYNKRLEEGVLQMAKERQIGFPWLAKAYGELFAMSDRTTINYLRNKKRPALRASEVVKEEAKRRREAEREKKIFQYIIEYYENIAPFLIDLKEELDLPTQEDQELLREYSPEELQDTTTLYLTKEEYRKLPSSERNQMALDRFWKRPKSKWLIGRLFERYIGYLYEQQGYDVEYVGIFKGYEDLGRDLICQKGQDIIIIQCKNWAKFRTIYEKHIFQFFGTVFQYRDSNSNKNVSGIFTTTTSVSELARRFANELKIKLEENILFNKNYPCIKCNISRINGEKIYHLPFDQQYDTTKIEPSRGELYCATAKEAEEKGFRRAFRYHQTKE